MGKFANKPKGRPTKRKTLKLKYKIERKVKQHKRRVKKEARKLKSKGVHHSKTKEGFLPNLFPFKQQILDNIKRSKQTEDEVEHLQLDASEYGMINIENKCAYLPKPKDNLIKKYVNNLPALLLKVSVVLELLDARNPKMCIDEAFRKECHGKGIKVISVLTKVDTVKRHLAEVEEEAKQYCETLLKYSIDHKVKGEYMEAIISALKDAGEGIVLVVGKTFTGKHTFITHLGKHIGKYQ